MQADWRESDLGACWGRSVRVVAPTSPVTNHSPSKHCQQWLRTRWRHPLKAMLSFINQPARAHSCKLCWVAYGHLSNRASRCPGRDSCDIMFATMWVWAAGGKSEPIPLPAVDLTVPHHRGRTSYRCHKMLNRHRWTEKKHVGKEMSKLVKKVEGER